MAYKHSAITHAVINAFYHVYNTLGYGFLEKVYENALAHELRKRGHHVVQQAPVKVYYDEVQVGDYYADLIVDAAVIVELKAADAVAPEHEAQLLNYLRATEIDVGLLLNFGPQATVRRKIYDTARAR